MTTTEIEVKERPILFSAAMVCAILEGRKTQTRRVVRAPTKTTFAAMNGIGNAVFTEDEVKFHEVTCPYGQPGDRLWVRETFFPVIDASDVDPDATPGWLEYTGDEPELDPVTVLYRATDNHYPEHWKPSIFMPRWASRIALEISDVDVGRVQDISEVDALAEGVDLVPGHKFCPPGGNDFRDYTARDAYQALWDSINGKKHPWVSNPWVWALTA